MSPSRRQNGWTGDAAVELAKHIISLIYPYSLIDGSIILNYSHELQITCRTCLIPGQATARHGVASHRLCRRFLRPQHLLLQLTIQWRYCNVAWFLYMWRCVVMNQARPYLLLLRLCVCVSFKFVNVPFFFPLIHVHMFIHLVFKDSSHVF